jgi:hypothetical protein
MLTRLGADIAMLVHVGMPLTFGRAGSRESDTGRQLRFQKLAMAHLVGTGENAARRCTDCGTIVIETDTGYQPLNLFLSQTRVCAGGAGFDAGKASLDTAADRVGMAWLFGVRAEHGSNGNGGHGDHPSGRASPTTRAALRGSEPRKVPESFHENSRTAAVSPLEFKRCH